MTGKNPAFQFYPMDWQRDLGDYPLEIEGAWIRICCRLWWSKEQGEKTCNIAMWDRILGTMDEKEAKRILSYIGDNGIGNVEFNNTNITVMNRRMYKAYKERVGSKERQQKHREKGGGDPARWTAIRVPILERDEYMCAYCGRKADTVDHVFPKIKGGDESDNNLVACCKRCNMHKRDRTPEEAKMTFWTGFNKTKLKNNTFITPLSSSSVLHTSKNNTYIDESKRVIDELNNISGRRFKHTKANLEPIGARLKEGFTEQDCQQVIKTKWNDKDFDKKYFRPSTLFRPSKFEGYLNEQAKPKANW